MSKRILSLIVAIHVSKNIAYYASMRPQRPSTDEEYRDSENAAHD